MSQAEASSSASSWPGPSRVAHHEACASADRGRAAGAAGRATWRDADRRQSGRWFLRSTHGVRGRRACPNLTMPVQNPAAVRLHRSAHPHLQFVLAHLGGRLHPPGPGASLQRRWARRSRAADSDQPNAPFVVLAQQHHGAIEIGIDQLEGIESNREGAREEDIKSRHLVI